MAENESGADTASKPKSAQVPPAVAVVEPSANAYDPKSATPEQHAYATDNGPAKYNGPKETAPTVLTFNGRQERARFSIAHECASILHGWLEHEHHADEPIKISREDYALALKAAVEPFHAPTCPKRGHVLGDPKDAKRHAAILKLHGSPIPHKPALSKYAHRAHAQVLELAELVNPAAEQAK